ncbi:MAG: helix-turn-helix domain-containing protein [Planctomycetota bacterium]|nr:MAG: helix-turn-helix domain-containing protein [Planctomycetota bacterium]
MVSEMEHALQTTEAAMGLPVVVHDLLHVLWDHLPMERFRHAQPICQGVKTGPHGDRCLRFECGDCRHQAQQWPQGRLQRCHAGFSELVQPVFCDGRLSFVLFAGPAFYDAAQSGPGLHDHLEPPSPAWRPSGWQRLPRLERDQLPRQREHLRQLAARLSCWYRDQPRLQQGHAAEWRSRRQTIERVISSRHAEPLSLADLAAALGIGSERCRHLVRQLCGASFSQLLQAARLQAACALLLNSDLAVSEIGVRCGFPDPSGFNRHFRAAQGMSPGRWRARHRG